MKVLRNQLVLPLNFEILIDENDPVWKLTEICDGLDYTRLYDEYLRHWRIINPVILFEILVFAYMNGIYSSRAIEHACKTDVLIISLTSTGLLRCILAKLPPHTEKAEFMRCAVPLGTVLFLAFDVFLRVKKTCLLFGTFVQNDIRKRTAFQKNTNKIKNREKIYCKTQLGLI